MAERQQCPICQALLREATIDAPDRLHGTGAQHAVSRCRDCGAGVTLPRVGDEKLAAFYPEDYGPYDERMRPFERVLSYAIRTLQRWSMLRSAPLGALCGRQPGRGLDVGCGRGDLAAALLARGWRMTGVEPSPSACTLASMRGIEVRQGTVTSVELEPAAYQVAIFRHSLEHTTDPVAALRRVAAALVPGGLVLITVPNLECWQARRLRGYWYHLDLPRHRVHFTPRALSHALCGASLEVLSVSTSSTAVGLPASLQYRIFGRCLFPSGLGLRVASGLCALLLPLVASLNRAAGAGDVLHAVARRPA
jgi:SAM-dependent methyltransferase